LEGTYRYDSDCLGENPESNWERSKELSEERKKATKYRKSAGERIERKMQTRVRRSSQVNELGIKREWEKFVLLNE